ncbi:hypothetical protein [Natrinema sp. SYSU A 869]|uniref:hypothetical protein n=1 Tax=Natrinema sp. SYSU A 869 TaxID=2871694 RepID=UPI0021042EC2|nr:hypothetical protein [Natrinema sp. SYSU A 869]
MDDDRSDREPIVSEGPYAIVNASDGERADYWLVSTDDDGIGDAADHQRGVPIDDTSIADLDAAVSRLRGLKTDVKDASESVELTCHECGKRGHTPGRTSTRRVRTARRRFPPRGSVRECVIARVTTDLEGHRHHEHEGRTIVSGGVESRHPSQHGSEDTKTRLPVGLRTPTECTMTRPTRLETIVGIGTSVATVGETGVVAGPTDSAAVLETEWETDYPRCVYQPDGDGGWDVTMPITMHVAVPGEQRALTAIEAEFTGLENPRWTRVFPNAETVAWDSDSEELVAPNYSVRRPRLGDEWTHVHIWELDADQVAIHAHLDVIDLEYAYLHRGAHYDVATRQVREHLTANDWRRETPYSIEYGVDEEKRATWGPTGDTKLEYVSG